MTTFTRADETVDTVTTTARNADLASVVSLLQDREARRLDIVAPATSLVAHNGEIIVKGVEPVLSDAGVTQVDGRFAPTVTGLEGIADKTGIPVRYLKTMHTERPALWAANINHWLQGGFDRGHVTHTPDERSFMVRMLKPGDPDQPGVLRALLSSSYKPVNDLDILLATLDGIREAGLAVEIESADLSERRMQVRLIAPEITTTGRALLKGYRSPFSGQSAEDLPVISAGLLLSNSETGNGAMTIQPRVRFEICKNGAVIDPLSAIRNVHLGRKMDDGVIRWSDSTQQRNLDLVRSQTVDAVRTFLSPEYLTETVTRLERKAGEEVESIDAVRDITKKAGFSKTQTDSILSHFVAGGQLSRAGVFNAATSAAQTVADADEATEMETLAVKVLA
jgi:hypothetical protein